MLPKRFQDWFAARGWQPRAHQLALVDHAARGQSVLLVAPTGGGKTLAGFLPSLIDLSDRPKRSRKSALHTLYISPLKALAVDVARNLDAPVAEMDLPVTVETRTGDTPAARRQRQRYSPPDILLTTPEQLGLLLAHPRSPQMFEHLKTVVLDELHALYNSKRGDLLALGLARLSTLAPHHRRVGLSATVKDPAPLQRFLVSQPMTGEMLSGLVIAQGGAIPQIEISASDSYVPWAGHLARHAMLDVMAAIHTAKTALVFVNIRSQAERTFQELWAINDANLPIALHHGSLAPEQRRKVEAAMARGSLRAVVCTSTLDLGIDWGAVDKVICIGAPKGAARLVQRIGRANHRLDEPSAALLVPANRFEVLECNAARDSVLANELDGERLKTGGLDVLAQHVLATACAAPFDAAALFEEVRGASPYAHLTRGDFDAVVDFVATGGYALRSYDRYARLRKTAEGKFRLSHPRLAQEYRLNAGVIVEDPMVEVRLQSRGKPAGAGGPSSANSRNTSSSNCRPAIPSSLPVTCCGSKACARMAPSSPAPAIRKRKSPATTAASSRFPPSWRNGCARWSATPTAGPSCPSRCRNGSRSRNGAASCPSPASFWSRPFPAPSAIIWSAIPLRAGWRTRPWACC